MTLESRKRQGKRWICISYKKLGSRVEVKENQIMKNNIVIRIEEKSEYREVENLVRDSFWNVYRPGCLEHMKKSDIRK